MSEEVDRIPAEEARLARFVSSAYNDNYYRLRKAQRQMEEESADIGTFVRKLSKISDWDQVRAFLRPYYSKVLPWPSLPNYEAIIDDALGTVSEGRRRVEAQCDVLAQVTAEDALSHGVNALVTEASEASNARS